MQTQFDNEPIEQIPDPDKEYYCFEPDENSKYCCQMAYNFNYLMKIVLLTGKYPDLNDKIKEYKHMINDTNSEGWTALMLACCHTKTYSTIETVRILIELGANLNAQEKYGWTALMLSSCFSKNYSSINTIHELIKHGANLNIQDENGDTVLNMAYYNINTYCNEEAILELINHGAKFNFPDLITLRKIVDSIHRTDILIRTKVLELLIHDCNIFSNNHDKIKCLMKIDSTHVKYVLYNIYKNDMKAMTYIFPKLPDDEKIEWCKFIANQRTICDSILKHKNCIYEKPNNIISMCAEVMFNNRRNEYILPNKLRFLFDIKNEQDCMNKIEFYL